MMYGRGKDDRIFQIRSQLQVLLDCLDIFGLVLTTRPLFFIFLANLEIVVT